MREHSDLISQRVLHMAKLKPYRQDLRAVLRSSSIGCCVQQMPNTQQLQAAVCNLCIDSGTCWELLTHPIVFLERLGVLLDPCQKVCIMLQVRGHLSPNLLVVVVHPIYLFLGQGLQHMTDLISPLTPANYQTYDLPCS